MARTARHPAARRVAVSRFLTAAQTLVQQPNTDELRSVYAWLLGQLGRRRGWSDVALVLPYLVLVGGAAVRPTRALDVLAVGDERQPPWACGRGRVRLWSSAAASLATAAAVAVSGLIGFVGLVVPHIVRRLVGGSHRGCSRSRCWSAAPSWCSPTWSPASSLAPGELPIGVVTAFVGAPFFAALLGLGGGGR